MLKQRLLEHIRLIPHYPKEGVLFRDITPLIAQGEIFAELIEHLACRYREQQIDYVVGLESRGFIFGAALAYALKVGFIPIRKKGKLPYKTVSQQYALEYGEDQIEIHADAFGAGARVVLIDDLIATGGSAKASVELIRAIGGECVEACFLLDLTALGGSRELGKTTKIYSVLEID